MKWVPLKEAAFTAGVSTKTIKRWAKAGLILGKRLARGRGPWRIVVDTDGHPVDAP